MIITVVGLGHVGLVQAAALAALGHDVIGVDTDSTRVADLSNGEIPFQEPGLLDEVLRQCRSGRLTFTTGQDDEAYSSSEVIFLCVGTPPLPGGGANLEYLEEAARNIREFARPGAVVVEKSTVPPGTFRRLAKVLNRGDLYVASNPEFLREGSALRDTLNPDRIVVGANSPIAHGKMSRVYRTLVDSGSRYIATSTATAELSKHASNSFLAAKISFINAVGLLCQEVGSDVRDVAEVMGADPRIGPDFLEAGLGFGGSCFPKDVAALSKSFKDNGVVTGLLDEVLDINEQALENVVSKVGMQLWNLEGKKVAVLGAAFKAGTDDTRFSPALKLADRLRIQGVKVVVWDPEVRDVDGLVVTSDITEALEGADLAVIATDWPQLRNFDFAKAHDLMRVRVVLDARNLLTNENLQEASRHDFRIIGVGR